MRSGHRRKPEEQTRIAGAKADALLSQPERVFQVRAVKVHLPQKDMRRGEARVELDRLLKCRDRPIGAAGPHANQAERKLGVWVTRIKINCPLRQDVSLL